MKKPHPTVQHWFFWTYMVFLISLMWLPLGGVDLHMNNFVLGIRIDHLYHATIYLPCVALLMPLVNRRWKKAWIISIAIALTTEFGQLALPYRGFDINDLAANIIGVSIGCLFLPFLRTKQPKQQ